MNYLYDTDFESTVRDYEFTRRATQQIQQVIESEDFEDMDSEAIFRYLADRMEIVSFKDYLKRYLYERAQIQEPFKTVSEDDFKDIIEYSFDENAAPHSLEPTTTKWNVTMKGWLRHDSARRNTVFLLGFGLRMSDVDVSVFLTKVLKEEDFNFLDPLEAIYWYCFRNQKNYAEVSALRDGIGARQKAEAKLIQNVKDAEAAGLDQRETLIKYLTYLDNLGKKADKQKLAYHHFCRLVEETRKVIAKIYTEDVAEGDQVGEYCSNKITSADIEKIICSGIPVTPNGNLQKASSSLLGKQFHNFRLSRQRIDGVLKQQLQVDRYDLITLEFFLFSRDEDEKPEIRCRRFIDSTNKVLKDSGLMELHTVNPYETFILMCLLTEVPLATYADVWEMSFV